MLTKVVTKHFDLDGTYEEISHLFLANILLVDLGLEKCGLLNNDLVLFLLGA